MKTWVIGDIHGAYKALIQLIDRLNLQPSDKLIFLGDYADGWSETPKVIAFLMELQKQYQCVMIKGNHDYFCEQFLSGETMGESWYFHGGGATQTAYTNIDDFQKKEHLQFLKSLPLYHIDSENRLFVHGGFTHLRGVAYEYFENMLFQDRTLWELAVALTDFSPKHHPKRLQVYKEIYVGHTPTIRYGSLLPMLCSGVCNVDTGAAFTGAISALEVFSKRVVQSDPVYLLYPDEKGRN